jgi:hypothetical protein
MPEEFVFTDVVLDSFLSANSKMDFERLACQVRSDLPLASAIEECEKWIRRRAVRRSDYEMEGWVRNSREGLLWTWIEDRIMTWAFGKSAETRPGVEITPEYIAAFLQRSVEEVVQKKNTKHGIKGFF